MKASIIGAGTWGTALGILLAHNGHEVTIWSKFSAEVEAFQATHRHKNLPGAVIPDTVEFTADLESALQEKELVVLAVPSIFVRGTAQKMSPYVKAGQIIVSVAKGVEESTLDTMSDIIEEKIPQADVAVLSGPSHAEEVSRFIPTTIVAGAHTEKTARFVQNAFMCDCFRVYINPDIKGIEIGGATKNVIALAAGMADGLGYGDNTKAALITRGIAEIERLGTKMGCRIETFHGLSGIGDLIVTCASVHSRNRHAGVLMGQGKGYEEAMAEVGQTVEGVYAAKAARALAEKYEVAMPIVESINQILFEGKPARQAVKELMLRDRTIENVNVPFDA